MMQEGQAKSWRSVRPTGWAHAGSPWLTLLIFALAVLCLRVLMRRERDVARGGNGPPAGATTGQREFPPLTLVACQGVGGESSVEFGRLHKSAEFAYGRAVDLEGRPLRGVDVRAGPHHTHTDDEGIYAVPRTSGALVFSKGGYFGRSVPAPAARTRPDARSLPTTVLVAGSRLRGRVTARQSPVAGARLLFVQRSRFLEARSEADGSYLSPLLRAGEVQVEVVHTDYQAGRHTIEELGPGSTRTRDFELQPGTPLLIRIRETSGEPIPDATLWVRMARPPHGRKAVSPFLSEERFLGRSDDLGRLRVHRPIGALPWVRASAVGFHELSVPVFGNRSEVTLRQKPCLDGYAVDAESGLRIAVRSVHYETFGPDGKPLRQAPPNGVRHDGLGRFRVDYPPAPERTAAETAREPGKEDLRMIVRGAGHRQGLVRVRRRAVATPSRGEPLLVYLRPRWQVEGRVFGPLSENFPVRLDVHITGPALVPELEPLEPGAQDFTAPPTDPSPWLVDFWQTLSTDNRGRFHLSGLNAASKIRVRVQLPDFAPYLSTELKMQGLADLEPLTVVLIEGRKVLGKAIRKDGSAAAHLRVTLRRRRGPARAAWTDEQGGFAFDNVSPGSNYRLSIQPPIGSAAQDTPPSQSEFDVTRDVIVPHDSDVYYRLRI